MKTTLQVFLLTVIVHCQITAQNQLPNSYFSNISLSPCPFDTSQMIFQYDDWLIYQTQNDQWDGPVDSTNCIGLFDNGSFYSIDLNQINASKPFFIKSLLDDDSKIFLNSDWLYTIQAFMNFSEDAPLNFGNDCANGLCSGLLVGIEVPNEDNTGTNLRLHPTSFPDFGNCDASICLPTEKFAENYLKEFVFKVTFDSTDLNDVLAYPSSTIVEESWYISYLQETVEADESHYNPMDSTYHLYYWDLPYANSDNALVLHTNSDYPSDDNISYVDVTVEPNVPTAENISLTIDNYYNLVFQPFTSLQGGLVEGNDSLRHNLSLINDGGTICINFIEVNFGGSERFVYQSGNVEFGHQFACMQFMNGGTLEVADNATFHYGENGNGILALRQGANIQLGVNSTLIINNKVMMFEVGTEESHQLYMDLNAGSSLIFGEGASLHNSYSVNDAMKLNVYMNGGVLDDSKLPAEQRALIYKIYPEDQPQEVDPSFLSPNPAQSYVNWSYHAHAEATVQLQLFDAAGNLVYHNNESLSIGPNQKSIDLRSFAKGIYFLNWKTAGNSGVKKVVVQ